MKLKQVEKSDAIMKYLRENEMINLNIIGKIENNKELPIFTDNPENPSGVLVKAGYMHFMYTESDAFIDAVLSEHMKDGFYGFAGVDLSIAQRIQSREVMHWKNPCTIYAYRGKEVDQVSGAFDLRPIALEDAKIVDEFYEYRNNNSIYDIEKDIKFRPSSAVYVDEEPVCWVLVHEDNSMGIMYTKEDHRRKGLAEVVSRDLTRRIIENGQIPYLQIVDGNVKSHGLAEKCGFEKVGRCEWFGIIAGQPQEIIDGALYSLKTYEEAYGQPRYDKETEKANIFVFVESWIDEAGQGDYSSRMAKSDDTLEAWSEMMKKEGLSGHVAKTMDAWVVEKDGRVVGAALMGQATDKEDYMLHGLNMEAGANEKQVLTALMEGVKAANKYFVLAVVKPDQSAFYEAMGFKGFGCIDLKL